jgi:hypothetical protein
MPRFLYQRTYPLPMRIVPTAVIHSLPTRPSRTPDVWAMALAVACAMHCVAPLIIAAALPALALPWLEHPGVEWALVATSIGSSVWAITGGCRRHRRWSPLPLLVLGVAGLLLARLGPDVAENTERMMVVFAAAALVLAHTMNLRLLRRGAAGPRWQPAALGWILAVAVTGVPSVSAAQAHSPAEACFDVERLPARERAIAIGMLQAASDGEGLYTLAGGLKPVSSDLASVTIPVDSGASAPALDSLARLRAAAHALRCGELEAHVLEYAATYTRPDSSRYRSADTYIVHRASLRREIQRHRAFWDSLGVTVDTPVAEVIERVERAPRAQRWRGYGYLFGYPEEAVDFFVAAGEQQANGGEFVRRDFRRIETFRKYPERAGAPPTLSSFVYAVPLGASESEDDRALRAAAAPIYQAYVERRARFLGPGGDGIAAFWREALAQTDAPNGARNGAADPFEAPRPRLQARRALSAPRIDGRLDDDAWQAAIPVSGFHVVRPDYAPEAKHATRVRLLYDDEYLYVAAEMMLRDGRRSIRVRDLRREFDFSENENFSFTVGPLGDRRTAYQFSVTPYGSQRDVQAFDGGDQMNENWDALWRTRTAITDSSWTAEIAIPWATLRYAPDATQWEVNFLRNARHALETSAWAPFPRQLSSFRITFAGTATGIEAPPPRPSVRLRPFALTNSSRVGNASIATSSDLGGELIWSPDANTTVDLTLRTDFAQADVDRQVVNLERFSVFFPERRQFFLENADVLGVRGVSGRYTVQPFFSRSIGLAANGTPIPVDGGARYTYRSARTSVGALAMRQAEHADGGASNFGVLRASRFLAGATRVGGMVAVRNDEPTDALDGGTNVVLAVDGLGRIGEQIQFNGMLSTSHDRGRTGVAASYFAGRDTPSLYTGILGAYVDADYTPRTGFVSRPDVLVTSPAVVGRWQPDWRPDNVVWFRPAVITYFYNDPQDFTLQEGYVQAYVDVLHRSGALWYPYVERHLQRPTTQFAPIPGVTIAAGRNDYWRYGWFGRTDASARWSLSANISTGGFFDGRRDRISASARFAPTPFVAVNVDAEINELREIGIADTSLTTRLLAPELRVALSPRVQLATFYQYNTSAERGALNARFSWEFAPLSFLYVVYNDTRAILDAVTPAERQLVVKLVWFGQL